MAEVVDVLLRARMEASGVEAGVNQIQKSLKNLTLPKGVTDELEKNFSKLTPLLKEYQKQLSKGFSNKKDLQNFNALKEKISETFGEIRSQVGSINSQEVRFKVDTQEIDKLENKIISKTTELQKALSSVFTKTINTNNIKDQLDKVIGNTTKAASVKPMAEAAKKLFNAQDYAAYNSKIDELRNKILSLKTTKIDLATALGVRDASNNITAAEDKIEKFFNSLKVNEGKVSTIERLKQEIKDLGINLENVKLDSLTKGANELQGIDGLIEQLNSSLRETGGAASDAGQGMVRMVDEVNELKTSTQYFFSLRNMINLLKRGIDEAVQSVKDLDKAMTETAVVTDFSVADMWKDLPKYTQIANELGATTQGAYETMTLYYQQGLDQQQAFALGAETMKMARIAGLDYAETTDMMTAALRGFNMELNETSAKRVNDVYSELAAITASDTEELGTAMQRTASIAASAGASFEGTTAFLAQAIETTREPAENIGTAMKTIVARFQEMKKNPLEISEVDGEEVDYNKIDAALKTIGVDLKDTNGQFREFDQVMLDISARWDGLSQAQQRYIATTAAGSRQQSRFIAMVSNYDRTMQLMEAANNSAGASDEQFGKTMDSLEAKLNKLHNAWQQFTMGIMNNNMVKGIVDAGTTVLSIVNKIIDVLSFNGQSGLIKSVLSLTTAFTALKGGGKIINSLIGGLGGLVDPQSSFKEGLKGGFLGGRGQLQADRISNPIVKAIYSLIPVIKGVESSSQASKYQGPGNYNAAREDLKTSGFLRKGNGISLKNVSDIFDNHQLNKEQQAAFLKASPGLRSMLSKQLGKIYEQAGASPETKRGMVAGFKKGAVTLKDALAHEDLHESFTDMMSRAEKSGSDSQMAKAAAIRDKYSKQFQQEAIEKGVNVNDYLRKSFANLKVPKEGVEELMTALKERSPMEKFQDGLGQIGAGLMSAGSTLQMFGATLSETNPVLGQFVSSLGSTLTTMGSLVNTIPALMNPWTLAIGAIGVAVALEQKRIGDIKKAAEEVSETFKETNKTTQENIASLKSYQSELATLSKGVDINGNNVSLSGAEYERYLEIVDEIATLNPEIVQGYNAQGHAIINNNKALDETIAKQEELQKKSLNDYIKSDSLQKLIDARNINGTFRGATSKVIEDKKASKWQEDQGLSETTRVQTAPMTVATQKVLAEMQKQKGLDIDSILKGYGISLEQLQAGEEKAVNTFVKNQDQINAQVGAAIASSGEEINESLTESFDKLSEQTANFDAAIAPVLQNLQTYVSNTSAFKNIGPEFQSALMSGLKDIVIQPDLDAKEMQEQARILTQEFDNLSAEGSAYSNAMKEVENAQNQFAESLDASEYTKNTEKALQTLDSLMSQYAGKTDAYSQAIAEYLQTQMDKIRNFTTDSGVSLTQAFNGVSDTLSAAEGAYSSFQESTKTDLSTGKDSMKSIFDEITKETDGVALHMEKFGDGTMWKGARALLGDKFVEENADNVDKIKSAIKSLGPELEAGEKGFAAFWENFQKVDDTQINGFTWNEDGSYDIDRNVNPDAYKQIAEAMHRSEEYVVAMLNAGKQFVDLDFHDVADVRKAFATDTATIKNGEQIFVKSDYYDNALDEAHIFNPNERKNIKEQDAAAGVIEIKNSDQITKDDFKAMGITNLPSLIQSFGDTGLYNKNEILEYAEALGKSGLIDFNPADFEAGYQHYLDTQDHPELQPIQSIDSTVQQIAGLISDNRILEGHYSQEDDDAAQELYDSVIGGKGADTPTQYFGEGKNEFGNRLLTPKEFTDTYAKLGKIASDAEKKAETYYQGAEAAEARGDTETADKLRKVGDKYSDISKSALANQAEGKNAWVDKYAREAYAKKVEELQNKGLSDSAIQKEAEAAWQAAFTNAQEIVKAAEDGEIQGLNENSQATEEVTNAHKENALEQNTHTNWQYGNVSQSNRPQGLTDENGNTVTVLGTSASFGTQDGGEIEIAYTPVVTLNGEGDILEDESAQNYINALIAQLESEGKEVNLDNILKLDASGEVEGFEGWKNIIADVGDTAAITAIKMHALEAGLNVENIDKQYQTLTDTIKKAGEAADEAGKKGEKTTDNKTKSSADVQATTYEVFTAGAEGDINTLTEKLQYLKDNYPEVHSELIAEFPQYGQLETYSEEIEKLDNKEVQQTVTASIATSGSLDGLSEGLNDLDKDPKIKVTVDEGTTEAQLKKIDKSAKKLDDTKTLKVKVQKTGISSITVDGHTWTISAKAKGQNNHGFVAAPIFGSAAGGYGQVGPKGKGGLTLTGEEGFEIAWLPNQNRSMILGANGPQMIDLPANAVIWTHEQSKKIIRQKGIPAGSADHGGPYKVSTPSSSNGGGSSKGGNKGNNNDKDTKKVTHKVEKFLKDVGDKIYKVTVWWENIARDTQDTQRRMDKAAKDFEKYTKEMQATLKKTGESVKSGGGGGNDYIQSIKDYQNLNQQQLNRANLELQALEASGLNPKAKKKQLKKEYKKGNVAVEEISYKKGKKSKTKYVDLSKYIKNGQVDEVALKAIKNSSERKAVAEAASKALNDERSKRNSAEDAIERAKEALDKFGEDLYETFHKWEIELTKIWNITQKIERAQARVTRNEGFTDLFGIQLESGFRELGEDTYNLDISLFKDKLASQTDLLYQRQDLITESRKELTRFLNSEDDKKALEEVRKKIASGTLDATQLLDYTAYEKNLNNDIKVAETAKKFSTITRTGDGTIKIDFDTDALEQARLNGDMTGDFAKAVQEWVKNAQELSNDISKNIESLTSDQAKFYNILRELQKQMADHAQRLVDMGEQNEKKRIDQIRKLSDSLKKAMDKLLKEVEQKLDERRKQEDNVKTERDISQKQQRLAMLRADTAGGHQVEIAQLEKEIAEAQQNYQRSLEDQLIDKLQEQSDIAVEQRERQIELQEALVSTANNIDQVNKWLASEETIRANKDNIIQRFLESEDYENKPLWKQEELMREANQFYEELLTNQAKQKNAIDNIASIQTTLVELDRFLRIQNSTLETAKENGLTVTETQVNFGASAKDLKNKAGYTAQEFVDSNLTKLLGEAGFSVKEAQEAGVTGVENLLNAGYKAIDIAKAGYKANDFFDAAVGYSTVKTAFNRNDLLNSNYRPWVEEEMAYEAAAAERKRQEEAERIVRQQEEQQRKQQQLSNYQAAYKNNKGSKNIAWLSDGSYADKYYYFLLTSKTLTGNDFKNMVTWGTNLGFNISQITKDLADTTQFEWKHVIKAAKKAGYTKEQVSTWHKTDKFKAALANWSKYKTGGLADYTGPAWLDGTPSKPELVLNSTDTKNFIALKDVLSKAMGSTSAIENTYGGDTTFEININVDHLNNDYDVDKVAERVKKIIVKDSSYRNVTQVRNFR